MKVIWLAVIFLISVTSLAREVTVNDIGKLYSQDIKLPISRQGSCLVFQYEKSVYCLSSIHVSYTPETNENFHQFLKFENSQKIKLEWVSADWGYGLVLFKLVSPPERNYLKWSEIPFSDKAQEVSAWGFPIGSDSMNQAYGDLAENIKISLFIFVEKLVWVANVSSEVGFSGGALINEKNEYMGLLSHKIIEEGKVYTVAISSHDVSTWIKKVLINKVMEPFIFSSNINLSDVRNQRRLETARFNVHTNADHPRVVFISVDFTNITKIPLRVHPHYTKFKELMKLGVDPVQVKWEEQTGDHFWLMGASPNGVKDSLDDYWIFTNAVEFFQLLHDPFKYERMGSYLHFLDTGNAGHRFADASRDLEEAWRKGVAEVNSEALKNEAPIFYERYKNYAVLYSKRKDELTVINSVNGALARYDEIENLSFSRMPINEQNLLREKYGTLITLLEPNLMTLLKYHKKAVRVISLKDLVKKP